MSKQAQSGLRSVQRDWSDSQPSSSQELSWPPTPPAPTKPLTGQQQRLKDIQDALAGKPVISERASAKPLVPSQAPNLGKRPSPAEAQAPAPKKRSLPSSWAGQASSAPSASSVAVRRSQAPSATTATRVEKPVSVVKAAAPQKPGKVAPVFLSQEQTHILKLVQDGKNVFYTGSAGTGKSVLLREIIKALRKKHVKSPDAVAVTASTGIAACNIGGVTIHSFAGIGLGIESAEDLVTKIRKNKKASARWLRTKALIIDEVSMVDGVLFDKLARIGSLMRRSVEPFGGIQVIVTGDFFQLPPVSKGSSKFAFEAELWKQTIPRTFNLTKVFRQHDQEFVDMLNEMRFGTMTSKSINKFRSLSREIRYEDGLAATELFPRREDVDRSNMMRMQSLARNGEKDEVYEARDDGTIVDLAQRDKVLANFMAPKIIKLRVDAQVMLIKNVDETLVNGSIGRVIRFADPSVYGTAEDQDGHGKPLSSVGASGDKKSAAAVGGIKMPVVEFLLPRGGTREMIVMRDSFKVELPNGEIQASRSQIPLILAWAMSIHKSQGQTLERVKVDLNKIFEKGQAYVALSRATSLDGLQVLGFDPNKVKAHPKVVEWSKTLERVEEDE